MKTFFKFGALAVVILIAIPIAQYKTVSPCQMLKKELVAQAEKSAAEATDALQEEVGAYGEGAAEIAEGVASVVENVAVGVASGVAAAKVERMSMGECVSELWRIKVKGEEP
jgi:hypothetical protein